MKSLTVRILAAVAVVSLIVNVLLFFRYSSSRPVATVGSTVITKKEFQNRLEYESGQAVLTKLVFAGLVTQAASKAGVMPTDADVSGRIALIGRQAPQLLTPYNRDPVKMTEFRKDLASALALENLRMKDVALTPAQVTDFYNRHQAEFALPQQTSTTTVVTDNSVDAATAAELLRENLPPDVIGRQTRLHVVGIGGYNPDMGTLPPAVKQQASQWALSARLGDVKTFAAGKYYLTFRVLTRSPKVIPPLEQVHGQVERAARLELAPSQAEEMSRLYRSVKPTFDSDKYAAYFSAFDQAPPPAAKKTANTH